MTIILNFHITTGDLKKMDVMCRCPQTFLHSVLAYLWVRLAFVKGFAVDFAGT